MSLHLMTKAPGPGGMRLLLDVVRGAPTLLMRNDEVEAAWAWIEPILEGWKSSGEAPRSYASGSMGPTDSTLLIGRDVRRWYEDRA